MLCPVPYVFPNLFIRLLISICLQNVLSSGLIWGLGFLLIGLGWSEHVKFVPRGLLGTVEWFFPSPQLSSQWLATSWKTWGYFLSIFETVVWRVLRWRSWLVLMVMAGGGDGGGGGSCPMGCSRPVSVWLTSALGSLWTGSPIKPAISGKVDSSAHSLAFQWIRGRKTSGFPWVKSSALSEPQLYWLLLS